MIGDKVLDADNKHSRKDNILLSVLALEESFHIVSMVNMEYEEKL